MSAKKETLGGTVGVVLAVCLACSIVVSSAAVGLRALQQANEALDKQTNILEAAGLLNQAAGDIGGTYDKYVTEKFVDLATGRYVEMPAGYDMLKAAKQNGSNAPVKGNVGFSTRAKVASVYLVADDAGKVARIVLPVYGSGLWDLMYGFIALDADGNTVREMVYYKHKETPGLGGEIVNPAWKKLWDGKQVFADGKLALEVKKGAGNNPYAVDALSGATLTSNGVENSVRYWLGEDGFGPYLAKQLWKKS